METLAALCVGVCLAAACGLRVFVPMLAMSAAARVGVLDPAHGFEWLASWPALIAFATAAALEIGGSALPWLDHAVDTIASPAALICGTLAMVSQLHDAGPLVAWSTGIALGGGAAAAVQATSVTTRAASTATTAGLLNPVIGAVQSVASAVVSVLAIAVPVLAAVLLVLVAVAGFVVVMKWRRAKARRLSARAVGA